MDKLTNAAAIWRFGVFEFDAQGVELRRAGVPVKLREQSSRILVCLLENAGRMVSREELRHLLWPSDTFVDFDHSLNTAVMKLREALGDSADKPLYIETIPKRGYRFVAPVSSGRASETRGGLAGTSNLPALADRNGALSDTGNAEADAQDYRFAASIAPIAPVLPTVSPPALPVTAPPPPRKMAVGWYIAGMVCALLAIAAVVFYRSRLRPPEIRYTQLTDFADSAVAPVLSPDGRMVAFIRGSESFWSADQIYVKMLDTGEAKQITENNRLKYGPAFSPDGSEIAYTVLESQGISTYAVSILGGKSHLLLTNAAGLSWLDQDHLLFSQIRSGLHMGIVTATVTRAGLRELYFPVHERAMAHYSYPSPDHRWALVVEMDGNGAWVSCRLIALDGTSGSRSVGPTGACTSAGWSPDGSWMYFTAALEGRSHLWRQRFPAGSPEQITFGPTEEEGVAVEKAGRSIITSVGLHESTIWIHDASNERSLSSEGEVVMGFLGLSPPSFRQNDTILYYLLRHGLDFSSAELWRMDVKSGESEAVLPGISMLAYDVSPDGKQVVYSAADSAGKVRLWLAPADRSSPARIVGETEGMWPHFGAQGQILFQVTEGTSNYLEQIRQDGSGRAKVAPFPIIEILGVSPGGRWVLAGVPMPPDGNGPTDMAIPTDGGPPRRLCLGRCFPVWSSSGKYLFLREMPSRTSPGRSLAIPVGPGESLPELPPEGIAPMADASLAPGSQLLPRGDLVPGRDPAHYAYVNTTAHRNLYRISFP
jgi:DNA-binding winged helix-turn-helix (wHTH) protein/Tol biopolymer transport system component